MRHQNDHDLKLWLREAKILQKASQSSSLSDSLPVLRRLINTNVLRGLSLPELTKKRDIIQRKHLLNMLAIENGSSCWAEFKQKVESSTDGEFLPYSVELRNAGYPVLWFSTESEATAYANDNGGKVVKVEGQAAVVPEFTN